MSGTGALALIGTLVLSVLAYQLGASMLTPALPHIGRTFGRDIVDVAQISSLFFLSGAVTGLLLTRWSDFHGRRRALVIALAAMVAGTVLCLTAPNLELLLVGRVLQGTSNSTFNLAYLLLARHLAPRLFGPAIGAVSAVNGGITGLDGYLGGVLAERADFRWIFVVMLVVGIGAMAAAWRAVPSEAAPVPGGRMDWRGAALIALATVCLTQIVSRGPELGWTDHFVVGTAGGAAATLLAYVLLARRQRNALVPIHHLRSRQVWPVLVTTLLALAGTFATTSFTVILLGQAAAGFRLGAGEAALHFLTPAALLGALTAPLAGAVATRYGWLWSLRAGLAVTLAPLVTCAAFPADQPLIVLSTAALGVTFTGCVLTSLNGLSVVQSPPDAPAVLPGLNGSCYGIGTSLGIAAAAPLVGRGTLQGFDIALWVGVTLSALALGFSMVITQRSAPPSEAGKSGS